MATRKARRHALATLRRTRVAGSASRRARDAPLHAALALRQACAGSNITSSHGIAVDETMLWRDAAFKPWE